MQLPRVNLVVHACCGLPRVQFGLYVPPPGPPKFCIKAPCGGNPHSDRCISTVDTYAGGLLYSAVGLHTTPTPSTFVLPPRVAIPKCVVAGSTEVCHVTVCAHRGWIGKETPPKCPTPCRRRASSVYASSVSVVAGLPAPRC